MTNIKQLEKFFATTELPTVHVRLDKCSTILDCTKMVETHLNVLKSNPKNPLFIPYYNRLIKLKQLIES